MIENPNYLNPEWFNPKMYSSEVIKWLETHNPPFVCGSATALTNKKEQITICMKLPIIDKNCLGYGEHLMKFIMDWYKEETRVFGQTGSSSYKCRTPVVWNGDKPLRVYQDTLFYEKQCMQAAIELYSIWKDKASVQ